MTEMTFVAAGMTRPQEQRDSNGKPYIPPARPVVQLIPPGDDLAQLFDLSSPDALDYIQAGCGEQVIVEMSFSGGRYGRPLVRSIRSAAAPVAG